MEGGRDSKRSEIGRHETGSVEVKGRGKKRSEEERKEQTEEEKEKRNNDTLPLDTISKVGWR